MAQRRTSTGGSYQPRQSLGEPYQIYTEVVNAGKNLQGSKRRVKWLFGFTESENEHEVILVHSLVSGKKTITEDGKEISASTNILATDFSHGWNSETCNRLFRIEASIGITSEHLYTFSIDGVKFIDLPRKPLSSGVGAPKQPFSGDAHRRASTNGFGSENRQSSFTAGNSRSSFQSPNVNTNNNNNNASSNSFDPFAGGEESFDPFNDHSTQTKKVTPSSAGPRSSVGGSGSKPPVKAAPKTAGGGGQTSAASSLFGSFEDEGAGSSADPFGDNASTQSHGHGADPFASRGPAPAQKKVEPKKAAVAEPDLFGNFNEPAPQPAAASDDFFSAGASKPQRRSSAQEISMDFAGLSFVAPPPEVKKAPEPVIVLPPEPVKVEEPVSKDPWDATKNLVDLDLSGRNVQVQKRASVTQGPSLDNLMGVTQPVGRRASLNGVNPADPFGAPSMLPPAQQQQQQPGGMYGGGGFAPMGGGMGMGMMPPGPPVHQAPVYGRGLGGGPAQPMMMGGGGGMMQQQQQQPMGGGMGGMGAMGAMGANPRGSIGGMPYGGGYQQQQQQQQPKNSLDSLNWKN